MKSPRRFARYRNALLRLVLIPLIALGCHGIAAAQIPDTFENLQILPKDIDKGQLLGVMKSYTRALGVRCQHCHIGEEGRPLSTFDFVSDEKATKKTTRTMMRMVDEINSKFIATLGGDETPRFAVRCMTCHHGQARPQTLGQALAQVLEVKGLDAALEHYQELRQQYFGSHTFDFSDDALLALGQQLIEGGKKVEATAFLERNAELYPDSAMTHYFLGELYGEAGDKPKALASYRRALDLQPGNPRIEQKLEELTGSDH